MGEHAEKRQCEVCGDVRSLDRHHIRSKGMGGSKDPAIEAPRNKITLCRRCHRNTHDGKWVLARSQVRLAITDARTGQLMCRRLYDLGFDAGALFGMLNLLEGGFDHLLEHIPYLSDEQLVELFAYLRSLGRQAWRAQAAILWEAGQRSVYGQHTVEAIARRFDIAYRTAAEYIQVYETFSRVRQNLETLRTFALFSSTSLAGTW